MEFETYLNACVLASYYMEDCEKHTWQYYNRQYLAFRARILRMDAEKRECILMLREERNQLREALTTPTSEYWFNRPQPKRELHHD